VPVAADQHLAVVDAEVDEWRRREPVHRDRHVEPRGEQARAGEVIGVRVRLVQVPETEAVSRGEREVAVHQRDLGIDDERRTRLLAPEHV
jgi:hypothetical protein